MPNTPMQLAPGGDIYPSRFVMIDSSDPAIGLQATANAQIIGISQDSTNVAPLSDLVTDPKAGEEGKSMAIFGPGDQCLVTAGAVIVPGNRLKSDGNGRAIPVASDTTNQEYGAIAREAAAALGELIMVEVNLGVFQSV